MEVVINQQGDKNIAIGKNEGTINIDYTIYNQYFEKEILKFLTPPPFQTTFFIGRDEELENLHNKLFANENFLILVNGQGGIGKTTFASKYWEKYQNEYSHLAFLYVENGITNGILSLANNLDLKFTTETTSEQLEMLLNKVSNLAKPCLLILDNANEEQDLNENITFLRKCNNFHILLTSRLADFEYAQKYPLGTLGKTQALELFKKYYPLLQDSEIPLFEEIYEAVGRNTLVLEILAKNLSNFNNKLKKRYTLQALKDDLQKSLLQLSYSKEIKTEYQVKGSGIRQESPQAIILAMYELTELSEAELALLSILAVLPAENIEYEILTNFLEDENLDETLLALAQKGWIEQNETTFKISPVVQEIVRHKNQTRIFDDCQNMMNFLIEKLEYQASVGVTVHITYEEASLYSKYVESILLNLQNIEETHALILFSILYERIGNFQKSTGNLNNTLEFFKKYNGLIEKLCVLEPSRVDFVKGLAISYSKLGEVYTAKGDLNKALELHNKETEIFEKLYYLEPNDVSFANGLAISYSKLGSIYRAKGDLNKVLEFFTKQTELFEKLYHLEPSNVSFANGLAISYSKLGSVYMVKGDLDKALEFFEKDLRVTKQLYHSEPNDVSFANNLAISYSKLGEIYTLKGDSNKAEELHSQESEIFEKLYHLAPNNVSFANSLAISYEKLGAVYMTKGDLNKALEFFEKTNILGEQLYQLEPSNVSFANGLAISYSKLGEVYTAKGNLNKSLEFFDKQTEIFEQLYQLEPSNISFANGLAVSYYKLYQVYLKMDKKIEMKRYLQQAVTGFETLKNTYPDYEQFTRFYNIAKENLQALE